MDLKGTPVKVNLPDSDVDWYDFGGGNLIAPTVCLSSEGKMETLTGFKPGSSMAAISCIRNGMFYYKILEGEFTTEDLPKMFAEYAPAFTATLPAKTQVSA